MPAPKPSDLPYGVYLDTTFLLDLADSGRANHQSAHNLLALFQKHRKTKPIEVIVSVWAVTEAHGVLYGELLNARHSRSSGNPRNILPPSSPDLANAKQQL